jgi:hypothetical protein
LQERLPTGEFDERAIEREDATQNLVGRQFGALGEGVWGVAVGTSLAATSRPDEHARQTGKGRFTLETAIDLVDQKPAWPQVAEDGEAVGRVWGEGRKCGHSGHDTPAAYAGREEDSRKSGRILNFYISFLFPGGYIAKVGRAGARFVWRRRSPLPLAVLTRLGSAL